MQYPQEVLFLVFLLHMLIRRELLDQLSPLPKDPFHAYLVRTRDLC